jgi:tetratricopeptide (TPR) repeat protein
VYAETSRFFALANRNREAAEVGRESLALARELGLRELQAHALNNIGTARVNDGDAEGFADLEEAFAIAEAINSPEALRALGNQASHMGSLGELRRSHELYEHVVELSRRLGISGFVLWCEVELALLDYHAGRWDAALETAEAFLATIDEAHYMEPLARQVRGEIMVGRGDSERGLAESERALEFARSAKDPQVLYPTMAVHARLLALAGRPSGAGELADELIALVADQEFNANEWVIYVTFALDDLGRSSDAAKLLAGLAVPTRWRDAATAYAAGDRVAAAEILGDMGDHASEAFARLRAAELAGQTEQIGPALAFYRGVGASAYVRRAEALLPATA